MASEVDPEAPALGWVVEYAKSDKSTCRATGQKIPKGDLRIGKEIDNPFYSGKTMCVWYLPDPLFADFLKGSAKKSKITSTDQLKGFGALKPADKKKLAALAAAEAKKRGSLSKAEAVTYLENDDGKFWSVTVAGSLTRVKYG